MNTERQSNTGAFQKHAQGKNPVREEDVLRDSSFMNFKHWQTNLWG